MRPLTQKSRDTIPNMAVCETLAFGPLVNPLWSDYAAVAYRTTLTYDNAHQLTRERRPGLTPTT